MSSRLQNIFLAIGVLAIVVMLFTFEVSYAELWRNLCHAGYWCVAVVLLWAVIYLMNTFAWRTIILNEGPAAVSLPRLYAMTVTGFALNYTTPVGLLGGEPYRILALSPYIGNTRAASSVSLFAMTHIFSHFWFWAFSIVLFLVVHPMNMAACLMLGLFALFCVAGILLILRGYRHGLAVRLVRWATHIPGLRRRMSALYTQHRDALATVDAQIASLTPWRLVAATLWEFWARIVGCLEIYFILLTQTADFSFVDCIFIQAFSSLFANLLWFMPMQAGTREGGLAIAMGELGGLARYGVYTGLITRVRELLWIAVGMLLLKTQKVKT